MLDVRLAHAASGSNPVASGTSITGLREDTDYVIACPGPSPGRKLFVDDVELAPAIDGQYRWRPAFYAGRALAELLEPDGRRRRVWLDVGPSENKSGQACFSEMVGQIRAYDPALLGGLSAATMAFGRNGRAGLYTDDILLSRIREHGTHFVAAVEAIARAPHRSLSADLQVLPLSRVRRLHPSALKVRQVLALCSGGPDAALDTDAIQLRSLTSAPTFDTPANRALAALMGRVRAAVARLSGIVAGQRLGGTVEEQSARVERRLSDLAALETRLARRLREPPFTEVRAAATTAAGLTQVAALPAYSRAYRLGCMALSTAVDGDTDSDALHVSPSWGIYEVWCYLAVVRAAAAITGRAAIERSPTAVRADLAHRFELPDGGSLETHFQAVFPSEAPSAGRCGWSISRERRPDILLLRRDGDRRRSMVLDAKWRSGRGNVLEAMESAHIYHDALRLDAGAPSPCVLLLPGSGELDYFGSQSYIDAHTVGALPQVRAGAPGVEALTELLARWLTGAAP